MDDAGGYAAHPPPDRREITEVSLEQFEESQRFLNSEDAIMDDSVFMHIKRVISYLYRKASDSAGEGAGDGTRDWQSECLAELNTNALNSLVDGYVGYAWLCGVCARWIEELDVDSNRYMPMRSFGDKRDGGRRIAPSTVSIVQEALMSFLTKKYDSEKMRVYMEDKAGHDKWNPPELYWDLMKSPLVVSHMIKIYRERPKDEFLSSWYQDYMNTASPNMKLEQADIDKEGLSRITSNFSVFTLRISEEIRRFLLKDDVLDSIALDNTAPLSPLFWHAENAYIYSQALLHFIYQWRIDLRGCRRLSQLIARTTMYPTEGLFPDADKNDARLCEWSASQIHLLMTNFARFPNLHGAFRRLCANQKLSDFKLNEVDVCDFYDELNKTLNAFDNYGILLFDQSRDCNKRPGSGHCNGDSVDSSDIDESVSQYGDTNRSDEYTRLRNAPEMPPLEAIRESNILNKLIDDFADEDIPLPDSNTWIRYANLLVLLSVSSPYEMLYFHYDELVCDHLKRLPQREVWKQFYLPECDDDDSSLDEIEHMRDYGADFPDDEGASELYSLQPHSPSSGCAGSSAYSGSGSGSGAAASDDMVDESGSRVFKAWNARSVASGVTDLVDGAPASVLSSSAFESELCHNMEMRSPDASDHRNRPTQPSSASMPSDSPPPSGMGKRGLESCGGKLAFCHPKRSRVSGGKESPFDRDDDEFLEIKSTLASAIYKNTNEDSRLGAPKNISAERIAEMKEIYASFKIQSDKVKGIARKELYQLYKLIHTASLSSKERDLEMREVISTNIAASVVMAYIRHTVVKRRNLSALCNLKLLLLKEIADKHTVKRTPIAIFLRDVCVACANGDIPAHSSSVKLDRFECIVDLLVYIARFERQCVPIVSIFNSIMHQMDRYISRHFISTILRYCGAPYGSKFMWQMLQLVENYLNLGTTGSSSVPNDKEERVMNQYLKPFVTECTQSWSDNDALMDIASRCEAMLHS